MYAGNVKGAAAGWLSPALMGIAAPILAALIIAPQLLEGAGTIAAVLLGIVLFVSAAGYGLSIMTPGSPSGVVLRAASRQVAIVRSGLVAQSEVLLPFAEVVRMSVSKRADRDGYDRNALEVRSRAGETWVIPCDIDDAELARMRSLVGLASKSR